MLYDRISGFTDEISGDFAEQIKGACDNGLSWMCLRNVNGRNICEYSPDEVEREILPALRENGLGISSLGSALGKVPVNDDAAFERQLALAESAARVAGILNCRFIRIFSFYIPEGDCPEKWEDVVIGKLQKFVDVFQRHGVIALHENEKGIYGDTAVRCGRLFDAIGSAAFRGIFDFANFVQCGEDTVKAYALLKKDSVYFHIKDALASTGDTVVCGKGDGQIERILADAFACGYGGFLTLEPHLVLFDGLEKLERRDVHEIVKHDRAASGAEAFRLQCDALRQILNRISA